MHKLHRIESWKKIFYLTAKNILLLDNNEQKWQCLLKSSQTYPTSLHRKEMGRNTHVQVCTLPKIVDKVQKKKKNIVWRIIGTNIWAATLQTCTCSKAKEKMVQQGFRH